MYEDFTVRDTSSPLAVNPSDEKKKKMILACPIWSLLYFYFSEKVDVAEKGKKKKKILVTIIPFPNKPWFSQSLVCSRSLLKTLLEKEKMLVTSNFSFSHSIFYHLGKRVGHFHQI